MNCQDNARINIVETEKSFNSISQSYHSSLSYIKGQKQLPGGVLLKSVLRDFAKFSEKHLCQSLFLNKIAGLRPATLLKKRLWHRCFPVNFCEISK